MIWTSVNVRIIFLHRFTSHFGCFKEGPDHRVKTTPAVTLLMAFWSKRLFSLNFSCLYVNLAPVFLLYESTQLAAYPKGTTYSHVHVVHAASVYVCFTFGLFYTS